MFSARGVLRFTTSQESFDHLLGRKLSGSTCLRKTTGKYVFSTLLEVPLGYREEFVSPPYSVKPCQCVLRKNEEGQELRQLHIIQSVSKPLWQVID